MSDHNKKRNTALVLEFLKNSITESIVNKDSGKAKEAYKILKSHFSKGLLREEAKINNLLINMVLSDSLDDASKIMFIEESYSKFHDLNRNKIEVVKNKLIREINYRLGQNTFNANISNYRLYALVNSIWNLKSRVDRTNQYMIIKDEVNKIRGKEKIQSLSTLNEGIENDPAILNKYALEILVKKYNDRIVDLLPEQKNVVKKYINYVFCGGSEDSLGEFITEEKKKINSGLQKIRTEITDPSIRGKIDTVVINLNKQDACPCSGNSEKSLMYIMEVQDLIHRWEDNGKIKE